MKITIIGTHGIPARYGGFETFAAHLAPACVKAGIITRVINDKNNPVEQSPDNVEIISSSYSKSKSPLRFYRESLKLALKDSDIIISCGVGGAFFYPRLRKSRVRIITNVDGLEHLRKKYTLLQRYIVYLLQLFAAKNSNILIADSKEVWGYWTFGFPDHSGKVKMISYGADQCLAFDSSVLLKYRLKANEYFLVVARLVPENNISEIINAFKQYIGRKKLVITGNLEKNSYVNELKRNLPENIIFTGAVYDKKELDSLRQGCFIYIHGHSVGGTNPSLLEAMTAGCACICHDNVFNREVTENNQMYFKSSFDLSIMLNLLEHKSTDLDTFKLKARERVKNDYNWENICNAYLELFNKLVSSGKSKSYKRL